jgi:hypothetical protein
MTEKIPDKTPLGRFSRNHCPPIGMYPGKTSGETIVRPQNVGRKIRAFD